MSAKYHRLWVVLALGFGGLPVTAAAQERDALTAEYVANVQEWTRRLAFEVERLQEDIVIDLSGRPEQVFYQRTDSVLKDILELHHSLKPGLSRARLYRDFNQVDRELHGLLAEISKLGDQERVLQRDAAHIRYADEQLHAAISQGDASPERGRDVIRRQAHMLATEAQELHRVARQALRNDRSGRRLEEHIRDFAQDAQHFHAGLEKGFDRAHLRRDFGALEKSWDRVAREINAMSPRENSYLRRRAERVSGIYEHLHRQLGIAGERPRIQYRFERKDD